MPLHHHGRTPLNKAQQRKRTDNEIKLEQAAGQTRHDIDVEPFDNGRWERAVATHTAGHTPAPATGGTLSAREESARLLAISGSTVSKGMCAEIIRDLNDAIANIQGALGANHSRLGDAVGPIQEVKAHAEQLAVMLDGAFDMVRDVGNAIG